MGAGASASVESAVEDTGVTELNDAFKGLDEGARVTFWGVVVKEGPRKAIENTDSVKEAFTKLSEKQQSKFCDELAAAAVVPKGNHHPKPELASFLGVFDFYKREQKDERVKLWPQWDPNGNGYLSLAEVDGGIQKSLQGALGDDGETIWRRFRPCYIRAFYDAKDVVVDKPGGVDQDDYVTKREFRLLILYLRYYATWFEVFSLVDGKSDGTTETDDRRISREEWAASLDKVVEAGNDWAPFAALQGATEDSFANIDADGKGMVLLAEFCKWVKKAEEDAGTEAGKNLAIGDDE